MSSTTRNILIGIVVAIIVVLLGYIAWQERQGAATPAPTSTATTTAATSTGVAINVSNSMTATSTSGYTVTPVYSSGAPTAPDYKTPLSYPAGASASVEATDESQFATIQTTLASSPTDWGSWIQLGILRQETGDYQGALADWKYVTEIYPDDPTAFADLGNLYATYLNEPSQAVTDYKEALKLDPTQEASFYENLAQVYINEGDTADATATLDQGISAQVVGYQNLQTMLNSMQ